MKSAQLLTMNHHLIRFFDGLLFLMEFANKIMIVLQHAQSIINSCLHLRITFHNLAISHNSRIHVAIICHVNIHSQ